MILYTSYYAKSGNNPKAISISAKAPDYFIGKRYVDLAPTWDMINQHKNHIISHEQYTERYLDLLINIRKLDPFKVVEDLQDGAIMLCYEKPTDFCHRHIVAKWITDNTGIKVVELLNNIDHSEVEF